MQCKLCEQEVRLLRSHVVPEFVYKYARETSPTHGFRTTAAPNRRVEDGQVLPLLCAECEQIFSKEENEFAKLVFGPLHRDDQTKVAYSEWALRFAVSVIWRALISYGDSRFEHLTNAQNDQVRHASQIWTDFLLKKRSDPSVHEVHTYFLEPAITDVAIGLSPYINRFLARSIFHDVVLIGRDVLVVVKMCRIVLVGFVSVQSRSRWQRSIINLRRGSFELARPVPLPEDLLGYFNSRAAETAESISTISAKQQDRIERRVSANPEAVETSELAFAMRLDVQMFGQAAFDVTKAPK